MNRVDSLSVRVRQRGLELARRAGEAKAAVDAHRAVTEAQAVAEEQARIHDIAHRVLLAFADRRTAETQTVVESIVTEGLQAVFGPEVSLRIVTSDGGRFVTSDFLVVSGPPDDEVVTPVLEARGGGLAAVTGLLLRVVLVLLQPERTRSVLVLDETLAHLSADYEEAMADFLRQLCDRTGLQVVMVTHSSAYDEAADAAYRVSLGRVDGREASVIEAVL